MSYEHKYRLYSTYLYFRQVLFIPLMVPTWQVVLLVEIFNK